MWPSVCAVSCYWRKGPATTRWHFVYQCVSPTQRNRPLFSVWYATAVRISIWALLYPIYRCMQRRHLSFPQQQFQMGPQQGQCNLGFRRSYSQFFRQFFRLGGSPVGVNLRQTDKKVQFCKSKLRYVGEVSVVFRCNFALGWSTKKSTVQQNCQSKPVLVATPHQHKAYFPRWEYLLWFTFLFLYWTAKVDNRHHPHPGKAFAPFFGIPSSPIPPL